jgi:hypothetical protein
MLCCYFLFCFLGLLMGLCLGETAAFPVIEKVATENSITNTSIVDISLPKVEGSNSKVLASGMTTIIPVWIRGDKIGKHSFRFLFGYQSQVKNKTHFIFM